VKTNLSDCSRVFRDFLRHDKPAAEGSCPPLDRLVTCVLGKMPRGEKRRIAGHAADCPKCATALRELFDVSRAADGFARDFEADSASGGGRGRRESAALWDSLFMKPAVAVLVGFFVITAVSFSVFSLLDNRVTRGGPETEVLLESPLDKTVSEDGLLLEWRNVADADYYRVELFDEALNLIWRSNPLRENDLRLPGETSKALIPGRTYFWAVTAVMGNRAEAKSKLAEFSVGK
jgi:hypothetical protein